jgi:hypothetical protein
MGIVCTVACKHFFSLDVAIMPEMLLATVVGHYTVTMPYEYQQNIGIVINLICSQLFNEYEDHIVIHYLVIM